MTNNRYRRRCRCQARHSKRPPPPAPDSGHHEVASDGGAEHWAVIASLVETCKLNGVDPTETITRIVNGHPNSRIDLLMPWAYPAKPVLSDVA